MTSLFFFLAVFFFFYELNVAYNPRRINQRINDIQKKEFFSSDETPKDEKLNGCLFALGNMLYMIWSMLGLAFSSQWLPFLLLFIIGMVSGLTNKAFKLKGWENSKVALGLRSLDSLACAFIIFDIFMTHFQGAVWGGGLVRAIFGL